MASKSEDGESGAAAQQLPQWLTLDKDADTKTPVNTEITGKIPKWLNGNLYRNGSGVYTLGEQKLESLLDGFSVIHRFHIHDGEVEYQSRILDSNTWVSSCKANRLVASQFATFASPDPCKGMFDKMMSYILPLNPDDVTDNTAINIVEHGDRLFALSEMTLMNEVDPESLTKKTQVDLKDKLPIHFMTPHPHFGNDGTMYNLGTSFNPGSAYSILSVPLDWPDAEEGSSEASEENKDELLKKATALTTVPSRFNMHVSFNHSFGMTSDHFVVLEQPVNVGVLKVLTFNWRREGFASNFVKFPEEKLVFRVIRRSDNSVWPVTFETDPTFCFHFINCYEAEEHLVVDLCGYDDLSIIEAIYLQSIMTSDYHTKLPTATVRRYVLPINVTEADADLNLVLIPDSKATAYMTSPGVIHCQPDYITDDKIILEMPRINYSYNAKKYRYAYGTSVQMSEKRLVKVDLDERKDVYWKETGYSPGEPIFVPKPGAKAEDDGVILSQVLSELPNTPSYLLVLDAKSFKEKGRAITPCDVKMANSFHGTFVPGKDHHDKKSTSKKAAAV